MATQNTDYISQTALQQNVVMFLSSGQCNIGRLSYKSSGEPPLRDNDYTPFVPPLFCLSSFMLPAKQMLPSWTMWTSVIAQLWQNDDWKEPRSLKRLWNRAAISHSRVPPFRPLYEGNKSLSSSNIIF